MEVSPDGLFQLTPSRRATMVWDNGRITPIHFNSRPHGGRRDGNMYLTDGQNFNSRPHGGRRSIVGSYQLPAAISTHALTEGDSCSFRRIQVALHFNSRPHGGRHPINKGNKNVIPFQLTPSRRATICQYFFRNFSRNFNSRPHGGRQAYLRFDDLDSNFNSRPHGGRLQI